jgi:hypothetical protein
MFALPGVVAYACAATRDGVPLVRRPIVLCVIAGRGTFAVA